MHVRDGRPYCAGPNIHKQLLHILSCPSTAAPECAQDPVQANPHGMVTYGFHPIFILCVFAAPAAKLSSSAAARR